MLLLLGVVAFFYFSINPNEVDFLLKCPLYRTTGLFCPGCGSQRSIHHLLHVDLASAAQNNVMLLIGLVAMVYHYGIMAYNRYFNGHVDSIFNHRMVIIIAIGILFLFWILRNIPAYPFTLLSPSL